MRDIVEVLSFELRRSLRIFLFSAGAILLAGAYAWSRSGLPGHVASLGQLVMVISCYAGLAVGAGRDLANGAVLLQAVRPISREALAYGRVLSGGVHAVGLWLVWWGMTVGIHAWFGTALDAAWPWVFAENLVYGFAQGVLLVSLAMLLGSAGGAMTTAIVEFSALSTFRLRASPNVPEWLSTVLTWVTRSPRPVSWPSWTGVPHVDPTPAFQFAVHLVDVLLYSTAIVILAVALWARRELLPRSE